MKRTLTFIALFAFVAISFVSCKEKVKPVSERIAKTWTARIVKHGSTIVYSRGGTNQASPGYANYSLNLASAPTVTLREVEGTTFAGNYAIPSDTKLVLSNLSPIPTGSGGKLEYTIDSITDTELILTGTSYAKTGGTVNVYTLTSN